MNDRQPNGSADIFPVLPLLVLFVGVTLVLVVITLLTPQSQEIAAAPTSSFTLPSPPPLPTRTPTTAPPTPTPAPPTATLDPQAAQAAAAVMAALDPVMVMNGEKVYQSICAACHGFNARGIAGLGKTLIGSQFVNSLSDEELHAFMLVGRGIDDPLNTTGVMMPARGGNPSLTDADIYNVIAYIRSLNTTVIAAAPTSPPESADTGPRPTATEWKPPQLGSSPGQAVAAASTPVPTAAPVSSFGGGAQALYLRSCSSCHGVDGQGVPYLAGSLADSALLRARDGAGLLAYLTRAQPPVDPRVAYPHPYRGGYPALSDQDILSLITYLYMLPAAR